MHTMFSAVLQAKDGGSGRGRFATAALLATGVHSAALLVLGVCSSTPAGSLTSTGGAGDTTEIAVQFMVPRAPAASPSSAPRQLASRPAPVRRRPPQPKPLPTVPSPVVEHSLAKPAPVDVGVESTEAAPADVVAEHSSTESLAGSEGGSGGSGMLGGLAGGNPGGGVLPPPPPPTLTREQRQQLTSRYLQELFRSRIASRFHYPAEAEELGLEGLVTLRVSIDSDGQLLGIRVQGACPHAMLCDAALRTVRESVPFPPPPAELGGGFAVDVPFQYRLE
jgi:protein TonB